jgi:tight adherence protein C
MLELFAFLCGSSLALAALFQVLRPAALRRLQRLDGGSVAEAQPLHLRLSALLEPLARRAGANEEVRRRLVQAGFRDESAVSLFCGGRLALPMVLALLGTFGGAALGLESTQRLIALVAGAGIGYVGPSYLLDSRRKNRQRSIRLALADALDLLVVCVEAGLSISAAISRVSREFARSSPPLCEELRLVTAEMQAGKAGADALRGLADRVGIEEVSSLVAMMVQSERFGTSIADALRIQADGMRKDRLQKAEERAQKASVRMLVPAALLIFPAILIMVLGPAVLLFMETFSK